jgi:diacylglycerol kinase family enzyme
VLIIVNRHAHGGAGLDRWQTIAPIVRQRWPHECVITDTAAAARQTIHEAAERGTAVIVAAGGDGCLNLLLNTIMDPATDRPRWPVCLGAIGLGSSNDFHKPREPECDIQGIPVKLDPTLGGLVDVGRVDWIDPEGASHTAYFLLNSSIGAVAKGNHDFNQARGILAWLKRVNTDLAIHWGSLVAIGRFANVPATLEIDGKPVPIAAISNLGVVKRVHFAGSMRYDTPVTLDDGRFDVNLLAGLSRTAFVKAILAISSGRFLGTPGASHWRAEHVRLIPQEPTVLEFDGEVHPIREVQWRVIPAAVRVCG